MAELVPAYVSNNPTPAADLPALMKAVHAALNGTAISVIEEPASKLVPAVPVKKSIHTEYLVRLETGERFQALRRHLSGLGMTPDEYRAKRGLAADYPMVARKYSERRSALVKSLGLDRKPTEPVKAPVKVRKPRPRPTAASEVLTKTPENIQEPSEAASVTFEERSVAKAPVKVDAPATAAESVQEPVEAQQQAA